MTDWPMPPIGVMHTERVFNARYFKPVHFSSCVAVKLRFTFFFFSFSSLITPSLFLHLHDANAHTSRSPSLIVIGHGNRADRG